MNWSDVLVQHPAKHAASAVRSATELPTGATPARGSTNTPTARASDARTAQTQRGSQSTGLLYSRSSPRVHVPLATAHAAQRAAETSTSAHKASRSIPAHSTRLPQNASCTFHKLPMASRCITYSTGHGSSECIMHILQAIGRCYTAVQKL